MNLMRTPTLLLSALICLTTGCQVLTYRASTGETFSRHSIGADIAVASLVVDTATNGVRRVELRGYRSNSSEVLSAVTEAAVRAALQTAKPTP